MIAVTPAPWKPSLQHPRYATEQTYHLAAHWLKDCATVADWGGGTGFFGTCLPAGTTYTVVDGTPQYPGQVLADLSTYEEPSDGILLRHMLEHVADWTTVLFNAVMAMRQRLVVVTFTPDAAQTGIVKMKSGWPVRHFNPDDLRLAMGPWLVRDEVVETTHPERMYYLERRS